MSMIPPRTKATRRSYYLMNREKLIAQAVQWKRDNHPRWLAAQRRRTALKLGLTEEQYNTLQLNAPCEICGREVARLCLDHDHTTGQFRGLLCKGCNTYVGHFGDDPDQIKRAISYLESKKGLASYDFDSHA